MKTMEPSVSIERECTLLGTLFQYIITDLKSSSPAWDDVVSKGFKLHSLLRSSASAMSGFVEAIQKIADSATHSKGSTKDVGTALTRICVRQKMLENKLKQFTNALMDNFLNPVQEKVEEWKKTTTQLEKDHTKEYKRATSEIKKRNSDTMRLQKKARKGSKGDVQYQINAVMCDVNERFSALEETEKAALRNLLVEERSRICQFANHLAPVLVMQVSMLNEINHLQDLTSDMENLCRNPKQLPTSTEQLIQDFISANGHLAPASDPQAFLQSTVSSSPDLTDNRKLSSFSSVKDSTITSRANASVNRSATLRNRHTRPLQQHRRTSSGGNYIINAENRDDLIGKNDRLSSASSRDSGFVSAPGWEAPSMTSQFAIGSYHTFKSPFANEQSNCQDEDSVDSAPPSPPQRNECRHSPEKQNTFSWKDWKIPGPYEIHNVLPDNNATRFPSASAPPPISPKPATYLQQQQHVEPQEQIPPRARNIGKSSFCYALSPANQNPQFIEPVSDDTDDPLPPPPPALLQDSTEVGSVTMATRKISIENESTQSFLSQTSSQQLPDFSYAHDNADRAPYSQRSNPKSSGAASVSSQSSICYQSDTFPSSSPLRTNLGCRNAVRAQSPQFHASALFQGDTCPVRNQVTRTPSPQLPVPNYMQGNGGEYAMTLGRKNSNNSLHHSTSSGYSSHHTTPTCSEDAIASHDTDCGSLDNDDTSQQYRVRYNYEKYSTLPRNYHHGRALDQSNRNQRKNLSTAEGAIPAFSTSSNDVSRIATIRRKPSARFSSSVRVGRNPNVPSGGAVANLLSTFQPPQTTGTNY